MNSGKLQFLLSVLFFYLNSNCSFFAQSGQIKLNNGISIAYESFGDPANTPMLLIQGTGATLLHYPVSLCESLAEKGYRVIRFDNRDIGLSTHLDSLGQPDWAAIGPLVGSCKAAPLAYSLLDMACDVIGLMDALNIVQANIVGASMGGAIAQLVAIHFPARILTMTCLSSTSGNPARAPGDAQALSAMSVPPPDSSDPDTLADYLINIYRTLGAVDSDDILRKRALEHVRHRHWDPASVNRQLAAVMIGEYCDRREQLRELKLPVMIVHGTADPLVPIPAGKELAAAIPNAMFHEISGMGHDISEKFVPEITYCITTIAKKHR